MALVKEAGFPRDSRLLKPAQYRSVFQRPIKTTDDCFTVLGRPSNLATPRLGLAVSKKYARLAVDRNRIKRVIRESFRKQTGSMDYRALFDSLGRHWKKIRLRAATRAQV